MTYIGRFAPSPTGPLHAGSLVAALASWLDARAHGGQWLVRIEDVDAPRCLPGVGEFILGQLAAVGLIPDEPPLVQSQHFPAYQQALDALIARGLAYPCLCSRKDIASAWAKLGRARQRHAELGYPGTCRHAATAALLATDGARGSTPIPPPALPPTGQPLAWRLRTDIQRSNMPFSNVLYREFAINTITTSICQWHDRRLGPQQQDVEKTVGDFPLKRADGCFTYQLAVVVDDAAQGITHVVRGEDLADNTARQILLQRALGLPTPVYLHTPLVLGANGEKLSKQNDAQALNTSQPLEALSAAAQVLGLTPFSHSARSTITTHSATKQTGIVADSLSGWVEEWRRFHQLARDAPNSSGMDPTDSVASLPGLRME